MTRQRPVTAPEMREHAEGLRRRAAALEEQSSRRFDNAPGAAVTGGSGRRRSGLHRRTAQAIDGSLSDLRRAKELRERAATWSARADRHDPAKIAEAEERRVEREAVRAIAARRESAARKAAPILNRPSAGYHLTAAGWAKIDRDYRALTIVEIDGSSYRVRTALRGGGLEECYLTDRKARAA